MADEKEYSRFPEEVAVRWVEQGAERLHVVDLDGATQGRPLNKDVIARIMNNAPVPIQLGGGIRSIEALEAYLDLGITYAILGTVAYRSPDFVAEACRRFPDRVMVGIDARDDRVSVEGWKEEVNLSPLEMARRFENLGVSAIVYTDILRDGMRTGPNVEGTRTLARSIDIPVIASGGISELSDVLELLTLFEDGVIGMITGKALYEGTLNLQEAIKAVGQNVV